MSKRSLVLLAALSLAAGSASAATARGPAPQEAASAPRPRPAVAATQSGAPGDFSCDRASEIHTRLEHRVCED